MRVAVIGVGMVGSAIGPRLGHAGHQVVYGVRDPGAERHDELLSATPGGSTASIADAAAGAEAVLLAVPWDAVDEVTEQLGSVSHLVWDATNPLTQDGGGLREDATPSGAAVIAARLGRAKVVKVFNCTGATNMASPAYPAGPIAMFMAGDDPGAKTTTGAVCREIGMSPVDLGPLDMARSLEHLALCWIRLASRQGMGPDFIIGIRHRATG